MKNKRKWLFTLLGLLICAAISGSVLYEVKNGKQEEPAPVNTEILQAIDAITPMQTKAAPKNIILMIGDGMGANHQEAVKKYFDLTALQMETMATFEGKVATFSRDSMITDSAAAATAMSCGTKVLNDAVARLDGADVETMTAYAQTLGKKTGVITTTTIYDATPACFCGHADNRYMYETIAETQLKSNVDILISGKRNRKLLSQSTVEKSGYTYIADFDTLTREAGTANGKLFAAFRKIAWEEAAAGAETPTLPQASLEALSYLERIAGDKGFFLMIEGAHIDTYSHMNKFKLMAQELIGFDNTVQAVAEWAQQHGDTMLIVTADHECGDLAYTGNADERLNNHSFRSKNHTGDDVRIFFYGVTPYSETEWAQMPQRLDNTNISDIMRGAMENYATQS